MEIRFEYVYDSTAPKTDSGSSIVRKMFSLQADFRHEVAMLQEEVQLQGE